MLWSAATETSSDCENTDIIVRDNDQHNAREDIANNLKSPKKDNFIVPKFNVTRSGQVVNKSSRLIEEI